MPTESGKVAVIIINYDQLAITCECIESILASNYKPFDLYVIDNGSRGPDYDEIKKKYAERVKVLRLNENIGYVGGINYALAECKKGDYAYCLIMNNDATIDSRSMRALVETSKKYQDRCIVSGKVYHFDKPQYLQYIGQACRNKDKLDFPPLVKNSMEKDIGQYDHEMEMGMLDDIFWLVPATVLSKVGFYCDYFFLYGEQNDYAIRAMRQGFKLIYTPEAKIWHRGSVTSSGGDKSSPRLTFWRAKSSLILLALHAKKRYLLFQYSKMWLKKVILKFPVVLFRRIRGNKKGLADFRAVFSALIYFSSWYVKRNKDNGFNPFK
jgi:GT2 family glycosyltransferase